MSNVKKPNQHLENVPEWWEFFVARFVEFGELETENAVFNFYGFLSGYLIALNRVDILSGNDAANLINMVAEQTSYQASKIINVEGA